MKLGKLPQGKKSIVLSHGRAVGRSRDENSSRSALRHLTEQHITKLNAKKNYLPSSWNQKSNFLFLTSVAKHHLRI